MLGYWRSGRVESFGDDELWTGDLGSVNAAGHLFVRDRKKLLIIRGGANVYPAEVERILDSAPGVRVSAVVGVPDPRLGQRVAAAVEAEPGLPARPAEMIERCRRHLARYKIPEQIVIVDELPRNAMGKVQRAQLAELLTRLAR
jgi:long-chain acyl-CoA synthetase